MIVRAPVEDDLDAVLALVTASDRALIGDGDWMEDDLRRESRDVDLARDAYRMTLYEKELRGRDHAS